MTFASLIRRVGVFALVAIILSVWLVMPSPAVAQSGDTPPAVKAPVAQETPAARKVPPAAKAPTKKTPPAKAAPQAKKKKIELFGTVEFKAPIRKLPKWTGVLKKMEAWKGYFQSPDMDRLPSKSGWKKLQKDVRPMGSMDRLKAVNKFFNQWPYRLDAANFGMSDYWAVPVEFLKKSGDCEDYSIAKFYALQELGFSGDTMRIVVIKDAIRGIAHAVLAVYVGNKAYILDNQTNMVLEHSRYKHYIPQYSVNEKYRWMHVPMKKK